MVCLKSAHVELCGLAIFLWTGMLSSGLCVSFGTRQVLSLAEEELKSLSQQTPFCFTALVIFFSPTLLLEKELTAVQINQRI